MQDTFTPGPWETSRDAVPDGHVQITIYEEATGKRVATAFEAEANAKLIASAPALLAALEALTPVMPWDMMFQEGEAPKCQFCVGVKPDHAANCRWLAATIAIEASRA